MARYMHRQYNQCNQFALAAQVPDRRTAGRCGRRHAYKLFSVAPFLSARFLANTVWISLLLKIIIILLIFPIVVFGEMEIKVDSKGIPILEQFSEEGFIDCVLKISSLKETKNNYRFHLSASHAGEELGINIEVVKGMRGGFDAEMSLINKYVYHNGVIFLRSGKESDRLIMVLAKLYGLKSKKLRMVKRETYTAIALHQGELNMVTEPVKLKIFGKDSDESADQEYSESFLNLDLANGFVYWNEKDQEYREPLVRGLSQ